MQSALFALVRYANTGRGRFLSYPSISFRSQIRKRLRIWSCVPVHLPQLRHGIAPAGHPADDLAGGGPGIAAVVNAAVQSRGKVGFGHGEDFL